MFLPEWGIETKHTKAIKRKRHVAGFSKGDYDWTLLNVWKLVRILAHMYLLAFDAESVVDL
jgi:hypothetical protein